MPKKEKGRAHSTRPVSRRPPSWCKYQPEEVEAFIINLHYYLYNLSYKIWNYSASGKIQQRKY